MAFAVGPSGLLFKGHQRAADLGPWALEFTRDGRGADRWEIRADLARADTFWLAQPGPFEVRLRLGRSLWCWKGVPVERRGGHVVIEGQGRPEERSA